MKKIEGTVEVEILIDSTGRVAKARVVRSIPALDAAALQTVMQWVFSPAIKNGRPVATVASAPVTFRIFVQGAGSPGSAAGRTAAKADNQPGHEPPYRGCGLVGCHPLTAV